MFANCYSVYILEINSAVVLFSFLTGAEQQRNIVERASTMRTAGRPLAPTKATTANRNAAASPCGSAIGFANSSRALL
jgi:hypothetical protein